VKQQLYEERVEGRFAANELDPPTATCRRPIKDILPVFVLHSTCQRSLGQGVRVTVNTAKIAALGQFQPKKIEPVISRHIM
jgi:hypothetical protein